MFSPCPIAQSWIWKQPLSTLLDDRLLDPDRRIRLENGIEPDRWKLSLFRASAFPPLPHRFF
jgi:hypothetical protein